MQTLDVPITYLWIGCDYLRLYPSLAVIVFAWVAAILLGIIGLGFSFMKVRT